MQFVQAMEIEPPRLLLVQSDQYQHCQVDESPQLVSEIVSYHQLVTWARLVLQYRTQMTHRLGKTRVSK